MYGRDKFGRAVMLLVVKKHSRSLRDLKQCMRFLCYNLDKAISAADPKLNPSGKVTGIFDLEGMSLLEQSPLNPRPGIDLKQLARVCLSDLRKCQ